MNIVSKNTDFVHFCFLLLSPEAVFLHRINKIRLRITIKLIKNMNLKTERMVLRPWRETDAEILYEYAKDERVGPVAGWPVHQSVEESREVIRTVFAQEGVFAVTLKEDNKAIGCIGVIRGTKSNFPIGENEGEISYWIGVPFWGQGLIPEAMREVIRYAFEDLKLVNLWSGYFDGNEKSKRAQEKCGFRHHHTCPKKYYPLTGDCRIEHVSLLTYNDWLRWRKD